MISEHNKKRLKRIVKELGYWRKTMIHSFEELNNSRFNEKTVQTVRENVDRDKKLIKHIDLLINEASELLGIDPPNLGKVPRVTIKKIRKDDDDG